MERRHERRRSSCARSAARPRWAAAGGARSTCCYLIAVTEFKRSYLGTALGYLWSIARPLLLFGVLLAVFTQAFDLGDRVPHYPVLLLFNIVLFGFFQEATTQAVTSIVSQESVVRKTQFPRLVIPLAVVLTSLFNLGAEPRRGVRASSSRRASTRCGRGCCSRCVLARCSSFTTAVAMIVSRAVPALPRHGDHLGRRGDRAVLRDAGAVPARDRVRDAARLIALNPLAPLFELARKWVIDPDAPGPAAAAGGTASLLIPAVIFVASACCGLGLQPRGAADRRGAVIAARPSSPSRSSCSAGCAVMERDDAGLARPPRRVPTAAQDVARGNF